MKHTLKSLFPRISSRLLHYQKTAHAYPKEMTGPEINPEGREREQKDFIRINKLDFFLPDSETN